MALGALGKKESLSEKAYQMLREAILAGELKPGDVLTEEGMADLLQISRTPVRSALQQLATEGFLTAGRKNMIVAGVDEEELKHVDQVRAEIEPLSAELVCRKGLTLDEIEELRGYCRRQNVAAQAGSVREFFLQGEKFHTRLAELSGNAYLAEMVGQASTSAIRFLTNQTDSKKFLDQSGTEHEEILMTILRGDTAKARERMREHVKKNRG